MPKLESAHPMAGPTRNAKPNAAPIIPIFFVFSAGVEISEIYACITPNPAPPSPPRNRAQRKIMKGRTS